MGVVVFVAAFAEGRLQGGRATTVTRASTRVRGEKQLRAPVRKLTEQEEDEILAKMEEEYRLEQASRQKAHEHAMKYRSRLLSDAELLQESHALDASLHQEEVQHRERAKEEKKQAEAKKQEQRSLFYAELEKLIQKQKEESAKYEAKMKLKKAYAARDRKAIASAKKAASAHRKAQEDRAKQMHEHTHKNDDKAVKDDEKRIMDMVLEERKLQEEARKEKMEYEQKLQQQYERRKELEQQIKELLMS